MGNLVGQINNLAGGQQGGGFQAQAAGIQNPFMSAEGQQATNNVGSAIDQQQALIQALQQQGGIGNQSSVFGQQQQLANALQAQTQGAGPNPAQAALAQNTANNTANQAALMGGQRGASQNVGLIARQAGQQGAANQQAAVGQAATMQAQQQLAAQQQLQQQQQMLAGLATQQVGQQTGAVGNLGNLALQQQQNVLGAYSNLNNANIGNVQQQNTANAGIAGINAKAGNEMIAGAVNSAGAAAGKPPVPMAEGGEVDNAKLAQVPQQERYNAALLPSHLQDMALMYHPHHYASGGEVSGGGEVPGIPQVDHNSYANDKVPALLSPKEIVLPLSVTQAEDAPAAAAAFVAKELHKHYSKGSGDEQKDFKEALKAAIAARRDK